MSLTAKTCIPCRGGIAPLTREEANSLLGEVSGWALDEAASRIERKFRFDDFAASLDFVNKVGALAEADGHHPDISLGWGYCTIVFYTHKIQGLHENDFIMAAKVNAVNPHES